MKVRSVGVDVNPRAAGQYFADAFYKVPSGADPAYPHALLRVCRRENVKVVFPGSDEEALTLAFCTRKFSQHGIHLSCPPKNKVRLLGNKADMYDYLGRLGIPVPTYVRIQNHQDLKKAANLLEYPKNPFLIKPTSGRGGRGIQIISAKGSIAGDKNDSPEFSSLSLPTFTSIYRKKKGRELIAMPYLSGHIYDVDVLADANGNPHYMLPRRRVNRKGIPFQGCFLDRHAAVLELAKAIQQKLRLPYLFDYDILCDRRGRPWLLEANPRPSGSMAASIFHGIHLLEFAILALLGKHVPKKEVPWGSGCVPFLDLIKNRFPYKKKK
jgi:carbamoyl-phosphate synthase large subunit